MAKKIKILGVPRYLKILRAPRFKYGFTVMKPLPWDKDWGMWLEAMSPAQLEVIKRFTKVAHETRGTPLHERMKLIAKALAVGRGGVASEVYGISREEYLRRVIEARRKSEEEIRELLSTIEALQKAKL